MASMMKRTVPIIVVLVLLLGAGGWASIRAGLWNPTDREILSRYTTPDSKFTAIDGVRIHYMDQGHGPAVVLVHGATESLFTWDEVARRLVDRYRVIRLDIPDHGLSAADPRRRYGIADDVHRIDVLMDHLGVPRFAIAGTSWGGTIAYSYAAARPERVSALVLISTPGVRAARPDFHVRQSASVLGRWMSQYYQSSAELEASTRSVVANPAFLTPFVLRQDADLLNRRGRAAERAAKLLQIRRDEQIPFAHEVIARVEAPTLVVWGRDNPAYAPESADDFVAALSKAKWAHKLVYPDVGHKVEREAPQRLSSDMADFMDAVVAADARPR